MNEPVLFVWSGINAYAVIQFFGRQNIIAAIDNDEKKQGTQIERIPIISLKEYAEKKDKRTIIITGFYDNQPIIEDLTRYGFQITMCVLICKMDIMRTFRISL